MSARLASPYNNGTLRSSSLYLAQGDEIVSGRPFLTGDVFKEVQLEPGSTKRPRMIMVLQHPCSMRRDGIKLRSKLLVARLDKVKSWSEADWQANYGYMALPGLEVEAPEGKVWAVNFNELYTVSPDQFTRRASILSNLGINILLQRWVHFSSRVLVPTTDFQVATEPFFEETELIESWCEEFNAESSEEVENASRDCLNWLREKSGAQPSRQDRLKIPEERSSVRREMNQYIRDFRE